MGDMNTEIGRNNNGYEQTMGREGLGTVNENGERFAAACADNNLVIVGQCSNTRTSIEQHGCLLTTSQQTKLTTSASGGSLGTHSWMSESEEAQTQDLTTTSSQQRSS